MSAPRDYPPFRCPHCHESNWTVTFSTPEDRPATVFVVVDHLEANFDGSAVSEPMRYHCESCHENVWDDGSIILPLGPMTQEEFAAYLAARLPEP